MPPRTARRAARIAALVVMAAGATVGCRPARPDPYLIELDGGFRFRHGDDPAYARPDLDDSAWEAQVRPHTWRAWTVSPAPVMGWYRTRFEVPSDFEARPLALYLGVIGWADETFVNGVRVGATGSMNRLPFAQRTPRLYRLPSGLLHPGGNVVAIRVRGLPLVDNGMLGGRFGIGEERHLSERQQRVLVRTVTAEAMLMGFLLFGGLLVAFFPKRGAVGRATLFLWASVTLQLVHLWLLSGIAHDLGLTLDGHPEVVFGAAVLAGTASWAFVAAMLRGRVPTPMVAIIAAQVGVAAVALMWPSRLAALFLLGGAVGIMGNVAVAWLLVAAVRHRVVGAIPIALGHGAALASVVAALLMKRPFFLGLLAPYYGLAFLAGCAMLALTRHVRELNRASRRASEYAVAAHTRERTRLARDLHDGVGQMLALLKLSLQRTASRHRDDATCGSCEDNVTQVDATLDELRRIARDLRPAPVEERGFGEAVRDYAAAMTRRTDLAIDVVGELRAPLREGVGDELYRIVQECLTNCLKHSGARRVTVTLADRGDHHTLTVADDGHGLRPPVGPGLGLATIRERSELLGGDCSIATAPGGGTRVEVAVPR